MSFIKCHRNEVLVSELLKKNINAFVLLYFVATRAWRGPALSPRGLEVRQALLGDFSTKGMTHSKYRTAINWLVKCGYIAIKTTNKGTVATLINTDIFDPNIEEDDKQRGKPVANQ